MKGEIDNDFYCSTGSYCYGRCLLEDKTGLDSCGSDPSRCRFCHRKHPTTEQYKEEYGKEYPDDGAVYFRERLGVTSYGGWGLSTLNRLNEGKRIGMIICACTPFGKPDDTWRPE